MRQRHLGESIHDLLDGRLRGDKAYAAMAHLGECQDCAARFEELRQAREALNSSQCGIDMRFAQQLLDRRRIAEIAATAPVKKAHPHRRTPVLVAVVVVVLAVGLVGTAWQAGAPEEVSLEFAERAPSDNATVAYVDTQGMRSGEELRSWIHPDFSTSDLVPVEANVVRTGKGRLALVATVLAEMEPITVIQQHGHLDEGALEALPPAQVEGSDVFIVEAGVTSTVVWQTGDVVVALTCECELATLEEVAGEFPSANDPGFAERVSDGFDALAEAIGN